MVLRSHCLKLSKTNVFMGVVEMDVQCCQSYNKRINDNSLLEYYRDREQSLLLVILQGSVGGAGMASLRELKQIILQLNLLQLLSYLPPAFSERFQRAQELKPNECYPFNYHHKQPHSNLQFQFQALSTHLSSKTMSAENKKHNQQSERKKKYAQLAKSKSKAKSEGKEKKERIVFMRISDDEEGVSIPFSMWCEAIKKIIKEKGGRWCPVFKIWIATRVQMQFIRKDLGNMLQSDFETPPYFLDQVAANFEQLFLNGEKFNRKQYCIENHPLFQRLYPFQRETLSFCLSRHGRILIADEMGVGKSIQSLACSLLYPQCFPILIICPSALKYVWKDEVGKWLKGSIQAQEVVLIKKGSITPDQITHAKVVIVSYEIGSKLTKQLSKFQLVICDEAHYLKNPDTSRCEQLVPFLSSRKRVFLLTGTPALAKPRELFNLLKILRPDIFKSFDHFGERYCERRQNPWSFKWEFDGAKNLAELHYILKKTVMIRRLKEDVLPQLPPKQRQIIFMETEKALINEIKQLLGTAFSIDNIRNSQKLMNMFDKSQRQSDAIMRCYLLSALSKLHSVKQYITSILQNDVKIIIFAHHKIIMDEIDNHLKTLKTQYIRLDGDCSSETRKKKVDHFQHQFAVRAALLSITAMGTGFTLTAASTVIFAQLHWTPAMLIQAEDRTHRIGQKHSVNIHYLIGDKTLDPLMLRQLERKIDTVGRLLDGSTDSLDMEVVNKGQFGNFEVIKQEENHQKGSKITDYFQKQAKFKQFMTDFKAELKEEQIQINNEKIDMTQPRNRKSYNSESEDSMMMDVVKQKRMEVQTQSQLRN